MNSKFKSKICLLTKHNTGLMYRVTCACLDESDDIWIDYELDSDSKMVILTFYRKLNYVNHISGFKGKLTYLFNRFKDALKILFKGELEITGETIISGEEDIDNFIEVLKEGKELLNGIKS